MLASTEALFLPRGLGRGSSEHLPTASRRHIAGRATPECVATDARVKDLAERNLPPAQNGRKRQRASEGAQMHSRERDSPNSRWTYALHAHCDRMPSMFGVCDRPKPPLLSPRLLSRAQATKPENLNQTSNEDLFSRVEAVLSTVNATDAARRAVLAPFVTNALALRIYNHLQERVNDGTCELPAQVALALVIFCMPMSVREAHKARRHGRRPRPLEARRRRRPRRARRRLRARLCCCLGCVGSSRAHTQRVCARVPLFRALVPPRRCPHRYEPAVRLPRRHFRAIQQQIGRAHV